MAETKYFSLAYQTGSTIYGIVRRTSDSYLLNDADGAFADAPADPYQEFTEQSIVKGEFTYSESRAVWSNGRYTITVYNRLGGSPAPATDTVIGYTDFWIYNDKILDLQGVIDRGNVAWLTGTGLSGAQTVTLTVQDGALTPLQDAYISVYDSGGTVLQGTVITGASGTVVTALDNGTYKLNIRKPLYTFTTPTTLTVDGATALTITGTGVTIGSPAAPSACRVYEYLHMPDDSTHPSTVDARAEIVSLPYDYNGSLHEGTEISGTYSSGTGLVYWDLVHGAVIRFTIKDYVTGLTRTIPDEASYRLSDLDD